MSTNPCNNQCGKTFTREVICKDGKNNKDANVSFCLLPKSSAGVKPITELRCPPCRQFKQVRTAGTFEYKPEK